MRTRDIHWLVHQCILQDALSSDCSHSCFCLGPLTRHVRLPTNSCLSQQLSGTLPHKVLQYFEHAVCWCLSSAFRYCSASPPDPLFQMLLKVVHESHGLLLAHCCIPLRRQRDGNALKSPLLLDVHLLRPGKASTPPCT